MLLHRNKDLLAVATAAARALRAIVAKIRTHEDMLGVSWFTAPLRVRARGRLVTADCGDENDDTETCTVTVTIFDNRENTQIGNEVSVAMDEQN